jgi:hypothetical protein
MLTGVSLPLAGSASLELPSIFSGGVTVKVAASAFFNWTFYFSIAVMAHAARVTTKKPQQNQPLNAINSAN